MTTRRREYVKRRQRLSELELPRRPLRFRKTITRSGGLGLGTGIKRSTFRAASQEELEGLIRAAELARVGRIVPMP
jgi:hypothetical protein